MLQLAIQHRGEEDIWLSLQRGEGRVERPVCRLDWLVSDLLRTTGI